MNPQQFQEFINAMRSGHTTPAPTTSPSQGANAVDRLWSINLESLLKLTNVSNVQHLPPIWAAIAKGPAKKKGIFYKRHWTIIPDPPLPLSMPSSPC